jgi:ribosomal protein S18 acetylase RimI-like enzyme
VPLKMNDFHINVCKYYSSTRLNSIHDNILEGILSKLKGKKNECHHIDNPSTSSTRVPFIIQKIGRGNKGEIEELTRLCIDVFFNDQNDDEFDTTRLVPPWKAVQLAYLRGSQSGDILARNAFKQDQKVDIIVARRIYSVPANAVDKNAKYVEENDQIFNKDQLSKYEGSHTKLVLGEIIGYCEVIEKYFGLGGKFRSGKPRPYLANLSVSKKSRKSGVGSKLLNACEEVVQDWNAGHTALVLQVEEDNTDAIRFYKKRGWEFVYADPTCRRYDTSGFFLKESRITKYAMMKRMESSETGVMDNSTGQGKVAKATSVQKFKSLWFVSQ